MTSKEKRAKVLAYQAEHGCTYKEAQIALGFRTKREEEEIEAFEALGKFLCDMVGVPSEVSNAGIDDAPLVIEGEEFIRPLMGKRGAGFHHPYKPGEYWTKREDVAAAMEWYFGHLLMGGDENDEILLKVLRFLDKTEPKALAWLTS